MMRAEVVTSWPGRGMWVRMWSPTMPVCFVLGTILYIFPNAGVWVLAVWVIRWRYCVGGGAASRRPLGLGSDAPSGWRVLPSGAL